MWDIYHDYTILKHETQNDELDLNKKFQSKDHHIINGHNIMAQNNFFLNCLMQHNQIPKASEPNIFEQNLVTVDWIPS